MTEPTDLTERDAQVMREITRISKNNMRLEWRDPRTLRPHQYNPKSHPSLQRESYHDFVRQVGWAGALLFNERTGNLLDGHMRQDDANEENLDEVPVLVIDVSQEDEEMILIFLDRIARAHEDKDDMTRLLLADKKLSDSMMALLEGKSKADAELLEDGEEEQGLKNTPLPHGGLSLVLGERYNYIVVLFKTAFDWTAGQDHFQLKPVRCAFSTGTGTGLVVDGGAYLKRLWNERQAKLGGFDYTTVSTFFPLLLALAHSTDFRIGHLAGDAVIELPSGQIRLPLPPDFPLETLPEWTGFVDETADDNEIQRRIMQFCQMELEDA